MKIIPCIVGLGYVGLKMIKKIEDLKIKKEKLKTIN